MTITRGVRMSAKRATGANSVQQASAIPEQTLKLTPSLASDKPGTKSATVFTMLRSDSGTTITEIMAVTNWQAHSVRGFLSGTVKKKFAVTLIKTKTQDGTLVYRIGEEKTDSRDEGEVPEAEIGKRTADVDDIPADDATEAVTAETNAPVEA